MARRYSRGYSSRRGSPRRAARRSYSSSRGSGRRSSRRGSSGARTIRIVVEQPGATQNALLASRGLQPAAGPRRRAF